MTGHLGNGRTVTPLSVGAETRWIEIDLSDLGLPAEMPTLDDLALAAAHVYERFVPYADDGWEWVTYPGSRDFDGWVPHSARAHRLWRQHRRRALSRRRRALQLRARLLQAPGTSWLPPRRKKARSLSADRRCPKPARSYPRPSRNASTSTWTTWLSTPASSPRASKPSARRGSTRWT